MKLSVRDLRYRYPSSGKPREVLNGLTLEIESGSYWCVAGPNGSGKSTFLKLIAGLLSFDAKAFSGRITWDGRDLRQWPRIELARKLAYLGGSVRADYPITVEEFVLQGRFAHSNFWSRPSSRDRETALRAIERVGIAVKRSSLLSQLSAGETQLALIARALAQETEVLLLDEATSNLDLSFQARMFGLFNELNKKGVSVVVVNHDINLAAEFCPNAIWLADGQCVAQGAMNHTLTNGLLKTLYGDPAGMEVGSNPFTAKPKIFWL